MKTYIVSDIHGHYDKLIRLLRRYALINEHMLWAEKPVHLIFLGDYFDRGPNGVHVIDLIRRLQIAATNTKGRVDAILGNHDIFMLGAYHFHDHALSNIFMGVWKENGGVDDDFSNLTPEHVSWLMNLPIMLQLDEKLLIHSDSMFYMSYGTSVDRVNNFFRSLLQTEDAPRWVEMMRAFTQRNAFEQVDNAKMLLKIFGGRQIIHGHTPIHFMTGQLISMIKSPLLYADRLCLNLDGGMAYGGDGFIHVIDE